jgi:MerR family redox-sensitive transcriptional activator SoxR
MADRTGLAVSAIRYYETEGLVKPERSHGGQRRYQRSDIRRLSFVLVTQCLGFTIADIRKMLTSLPDSRTPTQGDWSKLSRAIREELDRRISTMVKLRENLDGCIGCGCLSLRKCQLFNPGDHKVALGPGPRSLL